MKRPNLFIVGAAKAGTTSLWKTLGAHPEVFMPSLKEPHFFSGVRPRREWAAHFPTVTTRAEYDHLFEAAGRARYVGDASTSYLWSGSRAAEAIWRHNSRARIIAVLRDPVERAYSHYWNDIREGLESRPFERALAEELDRTYAGQWGQDSLYVDAGRYLHQIGAFLEYFGEQMLIIAYEDLATAPVTVAHRLSAFLDLSPATPLAIPRENVSQSPSGRVARYAFRSASVRTASRHLVPRAGRQLTRRLLLHGDERPPMEASARRMLEDTLREDWQYVSAQYLDSVASGLNRPPD